VSGRYCFLVDAGRIRAGIKRQRTVCIVFEVLILGAQRVAIQRVRIK